MLKNLYRYLATLVFFFFIDLVWIQFVANRLYNEYVSDILITNPRALPAIIFYILHALVLVTVTQLSSSNSIWRKTLIASLIGLTAYATYNLTNYSIIESWHQNLLLPDIIWGAVLSGSSILFANYIVKEKRDV
ncbi:MAG TPA: DUF2177 family protein [Candidatus Dojkabacteria bacterium]|nr:DUF2177 family protein [Candidatus Dojkabacteria bacterium]